MFGNGTSSAAYKYVFVFGFLHLAIAVAVELYVLVPELLVTPYTGYHNIVLWAIWIASAVAVFVLGGVPVVLWCRDRLVTPAVVTVGWVSWGLWGVWRMREHLPKDAFSGGIGFFSWTPYPDYLLRWPHLAVLIVVVVGVERFTRGLLRKDPSVNPLATVLTHTRQSLQSLLEILARQVKRLTAEEWQYGGAFGLLHVSIAVAIELYAVVLEWGEFSLIGWVWLGLAVVMVFLLGGVPVVLWLRRRFVLPVVGVSVWAAWGLVGVWLMRGTLPNGSITYFTWTPHPDYLFHWPQLLISVVTLGVIEIVVKQFND